MFIYEKHWRIGCMLMFVILAAIQAVALFDIHLYFGSSLNKDHVLLFLWLWLASPSLITSYGSTRQKGIGGMSFGLLIPTFSVLISSLTRGDVVVGLEDVAFSESILVLKLKIILACVVSGIGTLLGIVISKNGTTKS